MHVSKTQGLIFSTLNAYLISASSSIDLVFNNNHEVILKYENTNCMQYHLIKLIK